MNVFFIPSWYPSATDSLSGIFFRDQALGLVRNISEIKIGISTWGQNDEKLLLWSRQPFKTISKFLFERKPEECENELVGGRVTEYFSPEYTWSSKISKGNMDRIILANLHNLEKYNNRHGKVDIIHAHVGYPAGHIARTISERKNIPYIITEQMSPFPHRHFKSKNGQIIPDLFKAYQNSGRNVAISESLANDMKKQSIRNIEIIPNLVDETFFTPGSEAAKNEKFVFFSLGRMVPQKGIDILLKAFASQEFEVQLRIGGNGPFLNSYKKLSKDLGIDHKIVWLGQLDKAGALREFQNCDAFVLPSRHESMGVVFAEAMACGKPVIGTMCGGPEEFIDGSTGYLVAIEDVKGLVNSLKNMMINRRNFNAKLIREKFEERFSSRVVAENIFGIYRDVVRSWQ
jgi:glycosyltransferase involved in cell wall biosynthesis